MLFYEHSTIFASKSTFRYTSEINRVCTNIRDVYLYVSVLPQIRCGSDGRGCDRQRALCVSRARTRASTEETLVIPEWKYSPALPSCLTLSVDYKIMF